MADFSAPKDSISSDPQATAADSITTSAVPATAPANSGPPADTAVDDEEVEAAVNTAPPASSGEDTVMQDSITTNATNTQDTTITQPMSLDGTAGNGDLPAAASQRELPNPAQQPANAPTNAEEIAELEARIPQKKDATLREFLGKMDDYAPIIPDAVTNYYLTLAGLPPPPQTPLPLARLLALATQKFISDIAADAYQYARIRSSNTSSNSAAASMGLPGGAAGPGMMGTANAAAAAAVAAGGLGAAPNVLGKDDKAGGAGGKGVPLGMQRPGYGGGGQGTGQGRTVLTMEDLGMAVGEYGVNVKRGEFYR